MIDSLEKLEKIEIKRILDELKIPKYFKGYNYITEAIPLILDSFEKNEKISLGSIYGTIAKKHRITAARVERDIRYVHETIDFEPIFSKKKISNSVLLYEIADRFMQN